MGLLVRMKSSTFPSRSITIPTLDSMGPRSLAATSSGVLFPSLNFTPSTSRNVSPFLIPPVAC